MAYFLVLSSRETFVEESASPVLRGAGVWQNKSDGVVKPANRPTVR